MSTITGKVSQIIGPVIDVEFNTESELPKIYDSLEIKKTDGSILVLEVQQHIGEDTVRTISMDATDGLQRGQEVVATGNPIQMPIGGDIYGRLFNVTGDAIDGLGNLPKEGKDGLPIHRSAPKFEDLSTSTEGGWDLSKVDKPGMKDSKATFVFGQMNEPPGARARVALSGLTIAEYFRDGAGEAQGKDVLFFVDNIFRFTQAGSEVSALLGRMPSAVGYQPTLATEMGAMQERITSTKKGSITSVQAVYVPADDLTDPAPATTFAHLDATTVLSRKIAELGIYPAVDPLDSTSRILTADILGC